MSLVLKDEVAPNLRAELCFFYDPQLSKLMQTEEGKDDEKEEEIREKQDWR